VNLLVKHYDRITEQPNLIEIRNIVVCQWQYCYRWW